MRWCLPVGGIFRISDLTSFAKAVAETYDQHSARHENNLILDKATSGSQEPPSTSAAR